MVCRRIEELIELLEPAWEKESDLNLLELLEKLGKEAGFEGNLNQLSDEILIYHLKMRDSSKTEAIPGIKKDYEDDFKTALLKSRGIVK